MHSVAILRQVRRAADCTAQWDSAHPGDHRGAVAKSQRSPYRRDATVESELGPVALRDVVPQQPHTFPMIHDCYVHRAVIVVISHRKPTAHVGLRQGSIPGRKVIEETA